MSKKMSTIWTIATLLLGLASASAQLTISVNWSEFTGAANLMVDGGGVVPANNWQNVATTLSGTNTIASSGNATTVDWNSNAPGGYDTVFNAALDNTPMRGGILVYANPLSLSISDLSATFSSYDLIVYGFGFNGNAIGNQGSFALNDGTSTTTFYLQNPNPYTGSYIQSTDQDASNGVDSGTYVRFNGLTADAVTLTLSTVNANTGIGGFQITGTAVPEPSTYALLGGVLAFAFVLRRRLTK